MKYKAKIVHDYAMWEEKEVVVTADSFEEARTLIRDGDWDSERSLSDPYSCDLDNIEIESIEEISEAQE